MNKEELLMKMATDAGISKRAASDALDSFVDGVMQTLEKGDKLPLIGFGTFSVTHRQARTGVNPQTREPLTIPAKKVPAFKPGKKFKEAIK